MPTVRRSHCLADRRPVSASAQLALDDAPTADGPCQQWRGKGRRLSQPCGPSSWGGLEYPTNTRCPVFIGNPGRVCWGQIMVDSLKLSPDCPRVAKRRSRSVPEGEQHVHREDVPHACNDPTCERGRGSLGRPLRRPRAASLDVETWAQDLSRPTCRSLPSGGSDARIRTGPAAPYRSAAGVSALAFRWLNSARQCPTPNADLGGVPFPASLTRQPLAALARGRRHGGCPPASGTRAARHSS